MLGFALIGIPLAWLVWILPFSGLPFRSVKDSGPPPVTPSWALECWIWEDDANTAAAVRELLEGCREHDLPVRTVLIDSPWSTRYNDFRVDEHRYPDPERFFRGLDQDGYRVVLWMTSMVNRRSRDTAIRDSAPFFEEARAKGWLTGGGRETRWWKGTGGFLDYTHPEALAWWHGLQQPLFDWGIDGWKLDGTDTLFLGPGFLPFQRSHQGWTTTRQYMDLYAREEFRHGRSRNPEFIVLTRALDNRYWPFAHPEGFAPLDAAPVTWVGIAPTNGLRAREAPAGKWTRSAVRVPCWIGGSRAPCATSWPAPPRAIRWSAATSRATTDRNPSRPGSTSRWAQFAAFTGLFLHGGHGERRLWKRSTEELEIIRTYAWMHTELVPYLYTHVMGCQQGGPSLIRPVPGPYHYLLGGDLLVAPVYRDSETVEVHLPQGTWRPLFHPAESIPGGTRVTRQVPLRDFPVFIRDGAIVPLHVTRAYTGFGDATSAGRITWLIHPGGSSGFELHHPDRSGNTRLDVVSQPGRITVTTSGQERPQLFRILHPARPAQVLLQDLPVPEGTEWTHDPTTGYLVIRPKAIAHARYTVVDTSGGAGR